MKDGLTFRVERNVAVLGPEWDPLFAGSAGVQSSRAWLDATIAAAIPTGTTPHLLAVSDGAGPAALVPMLAGPGRQWGSLTTPYTCLYQPLLRDPASLDADVFRKVGQYCRQWPLTRFEAFDPSWPGLPLLRHALAGAGLVTRTFANFGNWHETVAAGSWEAYFEKRPGALRETVRRRTRAVARSGAHMSVARDGPALKAALEAYETVYRRSWKQPEPFPGFNNALLNRLAQDGVLRIGTMWMGERPIAAQYWSVANNAATVLKLAHDEEFKALSPGTVLTAATIRALIEGDDVTELDFGRGDDAYKRNWANRRRPRIGLLGLNPRSLAGMRAWAVHDVGTAIRLARRFGASKRSAGRLETSC